MCNTWFRFRGCFKRKIKFCDFLEFFFNINFRELNEFFKIILNMTKSILVVIFVIISGISSKQNVLAGRINSEWSIFCRFPQNLELNFILRFIKIVTEYFRMPPLYLLDDYDRCLQESPDIKGTYCYVRALIKPNSSSEIWNITNVSLVGCKHTKVRFWTIIIENACGSTVFRGKYPEDWSEKWIIARGQVIQIQQRLKGVGKVWPLTYGKI